MSTRTKILANLENVRISVESEISSIVKSYDDGCITSQEMAVQILDLHELLHNVGYCHQKDDSECFSCKSQEKKSAAKWAGYGRPVKDVADLELAQMEIEAQKEIKAQKEIEVLSKKFEDAKKEYEDHRKYLSRLGLV